MLKWPVLSLLLVLLCQCATVHQPVEFRSYFPTRPDHQFSQAHLKEMKVLESAPALTLLEKKRLWDLYAAEMKSVKSTSPRYQALTLLSQKLQVETADIEKDVVETRAKNTKTKDPTLTPEPVKAPLENPEIRKAHQDAYQLWNKEFNDEAVLKIKELVTNSALKSKASNAEWYRVLNLHFRISMDVGDLASAQSSYREMKSLQSCSADTAMAGFLLALQYFSKNDSAQALTLHEEQCDPDESYTNRSKRAYWKARFLEGSDPAAANVIYEQVMQSRLPNFYAYLTKMRLNRKLELPAASGDLSSQVYLAKEMSVSNETHRLFALAEERLRVNLRRDASAYTLKAALDLKQNVDKNILPLLYAAHLFQAAGNQLESMKIYSVVTNSLQENPSSLPNLGTGFLYEMFPRPHKPTVEWLCRMWNEDPDFIYAIMRQESAFNPGAVSSVDARGLMQLMPFLAKSLAQKWSYSAYYSDKILFNAEENLKLATFHLYQLRIVAPHLVLMTASYNAGLSRVTNWWRKFGHLPLDVFIESIPINETRNYVKLVMRNYLYYKALRHEGAIDPSLIPFRLPVPPQVMGPKLSHTGNGAFSRNAAE